MMNRYSLVHILLSRFQKSSPSPRYFSNCPFVTYLVGFQIVSDTLDTHVKCTGFLDHCDAAAQHEGNDELERDKAPVRPAFHHTSLTWTTLQPCANTDPKSRQERAILVGWEWRECRSPISCSVLLHEHLDSEGWMRLDASDHSGW
jgi:hypothetical protein